VSSPAAEIRNCLFDFAAAIGVGNQVCTASVMHEDASLQNVRIWTLHRRDFFPVGRLLKIRPDSKRRIFRRIIAVPIAAGTGTIRWRALSASATNT
jgi:hypothetical protein